MASSFPTAAADNQRWKLDRIYLDAFRNPHPKIDIMTTSAAARAELDAEHPESRDEIASERTNHRQDLLGPIKALL